MEEQHGKMTFDDITQDMASLDIEVRLLPSAPVK
jgi:hypothetical protein